MAAAPQQDILVEFDPLYPPRRPDTQTNYQTTLATLFGAPKPEGVEIQSGRQFTRWRVSNYLNRDQTQTFMNKIQAVANTCFFIRHSFSYWLRNIDEYSLMLYYHNKREDSRWVNRYADAETWLGEKEERLSQSRVERPNTKWVYEALSDVFVKIINTRQPLLGKGPLPDLLRALAHGRHGIMCLDTFQDNLCLWRCLAVHQGARPDRSTSKARELVKIFYQLKTVPHDCPKT